MHRFRISPSKKITEASVNAGMADEEMTSAG